MTWAITPLATCVLPSPTSSATRKRSAGSSVVEHALERPHRRPALEVLEVGEHRVGVDVAFTRHGLSPMTLDVVDRRPQLGEAGRQRVVGREVRHERMETCELRRVASHRPQQLLEHGEATRTHGRSVALWRPLCPSASRKSIWDGSSSSSASR